MTLSEFKAWFEGFTEGIADAPTPEQWAKIKAKIGNLREAASLGGREADVFRRTWMESPPGLMARGTSADPLPDRGRVIAQNASASSAACGTAEIVRGFTKSTHRVRDLVTGHDLGAAD